MQFCYAQGMAEKGQQKQNYDWSREHIQAQWQPFAFDSEPALSVVEKNYCRHYGLDFEKDYPNLKHHFGFIEVDGFQLATHYYQNGCAPEATFLVLHGYFDHSAHSRHLIEYCLQRNYAVLTYDLPGHGLSSGGEGEIDDFLEYVRVLGHYVNLLATLPGPKHIVGSSTGGAIIMEYLAQHQFTVDDNPFASILLLAPLVRPVKWPKLLLMYHTMRHFVRSVERTFVESSHDWEFVAFVEHRDPLQNRRVAANWIGALIRWVERFKDVRIALSPVVIQGGEDETIDWPYNLEVIKRNFEQPDIHFLPEARHQLINESLDIRNQVFAIFDHVLRGKALKNQN